MTASSRKTDESTRTDRDQVSQARQAALDALSAARERRRYVRDALDEILQARGLESRDAVLATELAMGVVRHRLTLNHILARFVSVPLRRLAPQLRDILRLGVYQLLWLDRVPDFAAVNEAVSQARRSHGRRAAGLVNAVLRQIIRHRSTAPVPLESAPAERAVRIDAARAYVFDLPIFPEPLRDFAGYLASATSHPAALVSRWLRRFGQRQTEQICWYGASRPLLALRPNRLRVDLTDLCTQLRA